MNYSFAETPHQSQYLAESTSLNAGYSPVDLQKHDFGLSVSVSDLQGEAQFAKETDNVIQKTSLINIVELRKKASLKPRPQEVPSPNGQQISGGTSLNKDFNSFLNRSFEDETRLMTLNDEKNMSFGEFPSTPSNLKAKPIFERSRISMNSSHETTRKLFESPTHCSRDTQDASNLRLSGRYEKYHENKMRLQQEKKDGIHEEITQDSSQRTFAFDRSEETERHPANILALRVPETTSRRLRLSPVNENEAENEQANEGNNQNVGSTSIENQAQRTLTNNDNVNQTENNDEIQGMLTEQEGNLYLLRRFTFLLGMIFLLFFTIMTVHGKVSYKSIFVTLYVYFGYSVAEIIASACFGAKSHNKSWRSKEDIFLCLDFISAIFWAICIQQKLAGNLDVSMIGSIPFFLMLILYLGASAAPRTVKLKGLLLRMFFTFQSFLIGFKLDAYVDIKWSYALGIFWGYCSIGVLYCAAFALILLVIGLFAIFKQRLREEIDSKTEFIGHFWYFIYYGCSALALVGIFSWTRSINNHDKWMKQSLLMAYFGIGVCVFLGLYIFVFYKPFLKFVRIFKATRSDNERSMRIMQVGEQVVPPKTHVTIEVQKRSSYFVMQSSTYFKPLDKGFFKRNAENMKEIKEILKKNWRQWGLGKVLERKRDKKEAIKIKDLKGFKESLDRRVDNNKSNAESPLCKLNKKSHRVVRRLSEGTREASKEVDFCVKRQLSVDDKYIMEMMMRKTQKGGGEENLCYLCFEKAPNAVFLDCGHGGICYDCGEVIVKKNNECMECRKEIKMICKLEPVVKGSSIIKGIELGTINRAVILE